MIIGSCADTPYDGASSLKLREKVLCVLGQFTLSCSCFLGLHMARVLYYVKDKYGRDVMVNFIKNVRYSIIVFLLVFIIVL